MKRGHQVIEDGVASPSERRHEEGLLAKPSSSSRLPTAIMLVKPAKTRAPSGGVGLATIFLAVLCVENSASMLTRRYAVGIAHLKFSKNMVLCVNEIMKSFFCLVMMRINHRDEPLLSRVKEVMRSSRKMILPAVVYLVVNLISYPALSRIHASVFTAISQLKVLATAFFAVMLLGTPISGRKWRTLSIMVMGVTLISWESAPEVSKVAHDHHTDWTEVASLDYVIGIGCAMVQTMLSGFAAIYFEKVLKSKTTGGGIELTVWDRNLQLGAYSILIYLPMALRETGGAVFSGFGPVVWFISFLHASGGILVALSVLYTSSVTKTVAVCGSLVLTTILGNVLFDATLNGPILLGCTIVILTIFGYRDDSQIDEILQSHERGDSVSK